MSAFGMMRENLYDISVYVASQLLTNLTKEITCAFVYM